MPRVLFISERMILAPLTSRFVRLSSATLVFSLLGLLIASPSIAQSFRQQYEDRIDAEQRSKDAELMKYVEPFVEASICFVVNWNQYGGGEPPIVCRKSDSSMFITYGGKPKGNYWDGAYSGSLSGSNGYYFSQMQKSGREDVAARLTVIDQNTIRVQYGSNACNYSPVLECQLSDQQCFSQQGPAGRLTQINKDRIIGLFK